MQLRRNLLAGLANSIWSAIVGLAVVPLYIKYLGIEAYGLIGFFVTVQAVLQLLDLGMSPTLNREFARFSASGNLHEARNLLHSLGVIYLGIAIAIGFIISALSPLIAEHWLQIKQLSTETVTHGLMLIGLVIACRWPGGLYQGALMGGHRLTVSSGINIATVTLASFGAVAVLAFISPTVQAFFIWQAAIGLLYAASMRRAAWDLVGKKDGVKFDSAELKRIWRFSAGVSGIAILAVVLLQLDKVLLSRMLGLADYGRYMLAVLVANVLLVLITPVFNVIYPRLSSLVATGDAEELTKLYRSGTRLLAATLFPIALAVAVSSQDLVFLWTGNLELATATAPLVSLLLIGTAINGVMIFPYALQLACGATRLAFSITAALIIIFVPMIILLVTHYGAVGGASAWALLNCLYLVFGAWMTHRQLLKGLALRWLLRDVGFPLVLALIIVLPAWELAHVSGNHYMNILLAGGLALLGFWATVLMQGSSITELWREYRTED